MTAFSCAELSVSPSHRLSLRPALHSGEEGSWGEGTGIAGVAEPADPALSVPDVISFRDCPGLWLSQELTPGTLLFSPGQHSIAAVSPCQGHRVRWFLQKSYTLQAEPSGHSRDCSVRKSRGLHEVGLQQAMGCW